MNELEFEGNVFRLTTDGFVSLAEFSGAIFDLSPEDVGGSFFDPDSRFFRRYEMIRHDLRHNVRFVKVQKGEELNVVCDGGIYYEDFEEFIRRVRQAINVNNQALDEAIQQWVAGVDRRPSFFVRSRVRLLKFFAALLRSMAKAPRQEQK